MITYEVYVFDLNACARNVQKINCGILRFCKVAVIANTIERTKYLPEREVKMDTTPLTSNAGLKEMSSFWREENLLMCSCRDGM
jgi:hypothetical protein